ncbi:unnamed protein product [Durusdinium trenchii]|uniref:Amine oxidase n=1 Tax=Durusdinium trenchii TaxID=1381693 RepID=A0ABP0LMT0_9DINO
MRRLSLLLLDWTLELISTVALEESPPWPLGQPSAWLWDLCDGVLVGLGHPGEGSPPTSLHKLQLPAKRHDWSWLQMGLEEAPRSPGKVVATLRLDSPVLVAAHAKANAPVLLGSDELRFLTSLLRASGTYPLHQQLSALSLTGSRPKEWVPIARAAAGEQLFAFLGFHKGPPRILQLKLVDDAARSSLPQMAVLRLVMDFSPRPPMYQVVPFEEASQKTCGFFAWDGDGESSLFELDFSGGPLEPPSVRCSRSAARAPKRNSKWTMGDFWPKSARGNGIACATPEASALLTPFSFVR